MKVKFFSEASPDYLGKEVNDFIKDKLVVSIKYHDNSRPSVSEPVMSAMVVYRDMEGK